MYVAWYFLLIAHLKSQPQPTSCTLRMRFLLLIGVVIRITKKRFLKPKIFSTYPFFSEIVVLFNYPTDLLENDTL